MKEGRLVIPGQALREKIKPGANLCCRVCTPFMPARACQLIAEERSPKSYP